MTTSLPDSGGERNPGAPASPRLHENHRAELRASGLTDETVAANGIYTETDPVAVARLICWSAERAGELGSVLVYPHFDPAGVPVDHVLVKPDRPRPRGDKAGAIKYENPRGKPTRLYVPCGARAAATDPVAELWISEGTKKALSATQFGFSCVSLPGVWNWCAPRASKNGKKVGRPTLNADLAALPWSGRPVFVCFDSDAAHNPDVGRAEAALVKVLRGRGAVVRVVRLPAEPDGRKNGLDDFLARHGPDALRRLIEQRDERSAPARPTPTRGVLTESGYLDEFGTTVRCLTEFDPDSEDGVRVTRREVLANFVARISEEVVTDDGTETTRAFAVTLHQPERTPVTISVPVERFAALDWVVASGGTRFVIQAGSGKRDHLRAAIQELSGEVPEVTVFTHCGWREIAGRWHYLHADGAIGADGTAGAVRVRLDGAASQFHLPAPPSSDELRSPVRASLGLLDGLAPDTVTFPLLATVYRAVLGPADYALWLAGLTGSQKSELAALAQQHFGPRMDRGRLPGNWASTDNALEGLSFTTKDAVLVIDDFAPAVSRGDADRQHRTAERLIRAQGNGTGRQRMRADATLRPPKPPRGLIVATGEDVPRGHSIAARLCVATVRPRSVNLARLTECQRDAASGKYAAALAGFVAWLAPQYGEVSGSLDAERAKLRDRFLGRLPHARTPDVIANLLLGLHSVLKFAVHVGAVTQTEADALSARGEAALVAVAEQQGEHLSAADPVARFPDMIAALVSSGRGHLAAPDGGAPETPEVWGWEVRGAEHRGRGHKIGWVRENEVYLDPDSMFAALSELAREQGQAYPLTQQTLARRLKESNRLVRTDGDRTVYPVTVEGRRRRVLVLARAYLFGEPGQPGHSGQDPAPAGDSVPVLCPGFSPDAPKPGHRTGTNGPEIVRCVPAVPVVPVSGREGGGAEFQLEDSDVEEFRP